MSEFIFDKIFEELLKKQKDALLNDDSEFDHIKIPLCIYNMIDRKQENKIIRLDISELPNLAFIQSLITKIDIAKEKNEAETFQVLSKQL